MINMEINIVSIVIMIILWIWTNSDLMLEKREKTIFKVCIGLIICIIFAEMCCSLYDNTDPTNRIISIIGNMVGFTISPVIFVLETFLHSSKKTNFVFMPAFLNFVMVLLSPYTGWIFYVSDNCTYYRGNLFIVFIIAFGFSVVFSIFKKIQAMHFLPKHFQRRIISSGIVMLLGILIQVLYPQYHTSWMIICIYFVLDYAIVCEAASMVDGLTGLLNKAVFSKQIDNLILKENSELYIVMIDVNDFKRVNDNKGHLYGDKCLIEIALILKEHFNRSAQIYRFGGDEFCVLQEVKCKKILDEKISHLLVSISNKKKKNLDFPDIAVGYAKFQSDVDSRMTIDFADSNMYKSKMDMKNEIK